MSSTKEKLKGILKEWKMGPDRSWDSKGEYDHLDLTATLILKLMEEIVPEESGLKGEQINIGWNLCRQTILDRLKEVED